MSKPTRQDCAGCTITPGLILRYPGNETGLAAGIATRKRTLAL